MKKLLIAATVSGLFFASAAQAGSSTGTMAVSASVTGTCKITTAAGTLAFGAIDPSLVAANVTTNTTFAYKCTTGTTPTSMSNNLGLNAGAGTQAKMVSGANTLNYSVAFAAATLTAGTGFGTGSVATTITENGTIVAVDAQNAIAGTYTDTVTITLNF